MENNWSESESQPFKFVIDKTVVSKESTEPSDMAFTPGGKIIDVKKDKRSSKDQQNLSLKAVSRPNPFKFFEEPDHYEDDIKKRNTSIGLISTGDSIMPLNIGDRVDTSDLNKEKYMNPTKRRKMSYFDFENRVEDSNFTLLDLLIMCKSDMTILEFLENQLDHVFDITKTFEDGRGFLYYAIQRNFISVVLEMIDLNRDIMNMPDRQGRRALHHACGSGRFDIVQLLVEYDVDLNVADMHGLTPLHLCLMFRHTDIGTYLLAKGCEMNVHDRYGVCPIDYLPYGDMKGFELIGMKHGDSGVLTGPDGLNSETMYKRRFDLLIRKRKIKPYRKEISFSECYTERDKGKLAKRLISLTKIRPVAERVDSEAEEQYPDKVDSPELRSKKNPATAFFGLESPLYAYSMPVNDHNDCPTNDIDSPAPMMTPMPTIQRRHELDQIELTNPNRVTHKDFTLIDVIGSGSFGEVYLVSRKKDNLYFAMKVYSKHKIIRNGLLKFLFLEKRILINFDHPFIVKVHATFQTPRKLYLIMDYCKYKDLGQYLTKNDKIPEHQTRLLMAEIVLAVEELHRRNIVHRDIKPDNILIEKDGHIKITDFGLSKDNLPKGKLTNTFCGSIAYLPPEIINRSGHGQVVDWYLIGELLYECLFGVPPFFNTSKKVLMASILNDEVKFPHYINRCTKDLILRLMHKDSSMRLGAREGATEVKRHNFFTGIDWDDVYNKKNKLFDTRDIIPYQTLSYDKDIVDSLDVKTSSNKILNWSVYR